MMNEYLTKVTFKLTDPVLAAGATDEHITRESINGLPLPRRRFVRG
jgi:hypothetical protein